MSRSRTPLILATAAAGGVGYYLYTAGGNPKVAEKQFESDAHAAAAKIRGQVPSKPHTDATREGAKIGSKIDSAISTADQELSKAKHETESYAKAAKAETLKKIDEFDRKVEAEAAKGKGYLSGWFGSK